MDEKKADGTGGNKEIDLMLEDIERDEIKTSQVKPIMGASGREQAKLLSEDLKKDENDKIIIRCEKVKQREFTTEEEVIDCRIFYWAAFNGYNKYLRLMILHRKWSPYIKSFRNRSIISGAVWGSQIETLRMLLGNYKYEKVSANSIEDLALTIFNKDSWDNNCLHYCYMIDLPEVRQLLRDNKLYGERADKLNRRGQLPTMLRHSMKNEDSNEEDDEEDEEDLDAEMAKLDQEDFGGLAIMGTKIVTKGKQS